MTIPRTTGWDDDLLRQCRMAHLFGLPFRAVWQTIIRVHPAVATGTVINANRPSATVLLLSGECLVWNDLEGYAVIH